MLLIKTILISTSALGVTILFYQLGSVCQTLLKREQQVRALSPNSVICASRAVITRLHLTALPTPFAAKLLQSKDSFKKLRLLATIRTMLMNGEVCFCGLLCRHTSISPSLFRTAFEGARI
jgi:hypothetical protein